MRLKFTLLFILGLGFSVLNAQNCDENSPPDEAADGCNCAYPDCSFGLAGFSGTLGAPNGNTSVIPECTDGNGGTFHNDDWIAFIAGSPSISITITPSNCDVVGGNLSGVQAGFYGACSDVTQEGVPSDGLLVQCACSTAPLTLDFGGFTCGQTYYIFLDGCGGSVCDYTIVVNSGSTTLNPPGPLGGITGPIDVCPGATVTYTVDEVDCVPDYDWTVTGGGVIVSEDGPTCTVTWNSGGTISTFGENACYMTNTAGPLNVTVTPLPELNEEGSYCDNEAGYNYNGTLYTAGNYVIPQIIPSGPDMGCTQNTNLIVTANPTYNETVDRVICFGDQVIYGGLPYSSGGTYDIPLLTVNSQCDSNITLNLTVLDPLAFVNLVPPLDEITCTNTQVLVDGSQSFPAQDIQFYNWTSPTGGDICGGLGTPLLTVCSPGTYCLEVSYSQMDPTTGQLVNCSSEDCIDVGENVEEPGLSVVGTNVECGGAEDGSATVTITGGQMPFIIAWTDDNNTTTETVEDLPAGTYTVSVFSISNGCTASETVTILEPDGMTLDMTSEDAACGGSASGSASVTTSGGSPGYTFEWNSDPVQTTSTASNLPAGTYTVIVTDDNGCTNENSIDVGQGADMSVDVSGVDIECNGDDTGTATATGSGGSGIYTYEWNTDPVQETQTATGLTEGTYTVIISDENDCTATSSVTLTEADPLELTTSSDDASCGGNADGSASVIASGGDGDFSYEWNTDPVQTTATASSIAAGVYTVIVTDGNGCSDEITETVSEPSGVMVSSDFVDAECFGASDGEASVTASGGTGPYVYTWNTVPIQSTSTATNLFAGVYCATIEDANDCQVIECVTIGEPTEIILTESGEDVECNGASNGEASVVASGGTGSFEYEWNTVPVQTDATATNLGEGTYTVIVTDENDCTASVSVTINESSAMVLTESGMDALCNDGTEGEASVSIVGGTSPYDYEWDTDPVQTNATATNLGEGTYTVVVTDDNGCTESVSVTIDEPSAMVLTPGGTDPNCSNSGDGEASISVSGGTGPYDYEWDTAPIQSDATATSLDAGTYTVMVTDENGCTATETVILMAPNALSLSTSQTDVLCTGESTGSATVTATGGTPPLSYLWDDGALQNTATATNLGADTYTVIVTDANDCTESIDVILTEPLEALSASGTSTDALCGQSNGTINLTVMGGTSPYTYDWGAAGSNEDPTNLGPGSYTVIVTDDNDCTTTASVTVDSPDSPNATAVITDASCFGEPDGTIDISIVGGIMPYTYTWDPSSNNGNEDLENIIAGSYSVTVTDDAGCTSVVSGVIAEPEALDATATASPADCGIDNGSISVVVSGGTTPYSYDWPGTANDGEQSPANLAAGTYEVTVTDDNNCTTIADAEVIIPNGPTTSIVGTDVGCNDENTGTIDITITGGEAPYVIDWSDPALDGNENLIDLVAGTYNVVVTDVNNCSSVASIELIEPDVLSLSTITTSVSCNGGNDGTVTTVVTGGTGPYTYEWCDGQTGANAIACPAGPCELIVTDANGCTVTEIVQIDEPAAIDVVLGSADLDCNGDNTGSISLTVTGGTSPFEYDWTGGIPAGTEDPTSLDAGSYDVLITDANGCTEEITNIVINEPPALSVTASSSPTDCGLDNGGISLTITGGTSPYDYDWPGTNNDGTQNPSNLGAGNYEVTVIDDNGCTSTASASVITPDGPSTTIVATDVDCNGNETGTIDITISGGASPYIIDWGDPALDGNENLIDLGAGTYDVVVTDDNNCSSVASIEITEPEILSASTTTNEVSCFGLSDGAATVTATGGTGPYTYEWCNGQTSSNASGLLAGMCEVIVTDDNGCTTSQTVEITEPIEMDVTALASDADCNGASTGSISLTVSGGTGPYDFDWTGGIAAGTEDPTNLGAAMYDVIVTDDNGCTQEITGIEILEPAAIEISFTTEDASCNEANGSIDVTVMGGTSPYTYAWTGGLNGEDPTLVASGTYEVEVTDDNGCTSLEMIEVIEPDALAITALESDANCNGEESGSIDITITGGSMPYTYAWDDADSQITEDAINLLAGTYTVLVTDDNGCTISITRDIAEPTAIVLSATSTDATCNETNGTINLTATGGVAPYVFDWSGSVEDVEDPANLGTGSYDVTVTDDNGCTAVLTQAVNTPSGLSVSAAGSPVSCFGDNNGTIDLMVSGGTAPFSFAWDDAAAQTIEDPIDLLAGNYIVIVTDGDGCTTTASATVNTPDELEASGTSLEASCNSANGSINLTVTGGVEPYSYDWSGAAMDIEDPQNLLSGTYDVVITDANGCIATTSVEVTEPDALAIGGVPSDALCNGEASGSINLSVTGGTGAGTYTYEWDDAATQTIEDPINLEAGTYTVLVTDENGCTISESIDIGEPTAMTTEVSSTEATCGEENGTIDLTVMGGTAPYSYDWSGAAMDIEDPQNLQAGSYNVVITDDNGCTTTTSVSVNTPNLLTAVAQGTDALCNGEASGSIELTINGGTGPYNVVWSGALGTDEDPIDVGAGDYIAIVTDDDGCEVLAAASVGEPDIIFASSVSVDATCNEANGSINLTVTGGTAPYTFDWDGGAADIEDPINITAGNYNVIITDDNGCTLEYSTDVSTPSALALSTTSENATCFEETDGSIDLSVSGGNAPFTYAWSNGPDTEDIGNLSAAVYTVTVTDDDGCTITASVTIDEPDVLEATNQFPSSVSCNGGSDGSALISAEGGTAPYMYDWSDNTLDGQDAPTNMASGTYTVTVIDDNGCTAILEVEIGEPSAISLSAGSTMTLCFGSSDGALSSTVSGGTPPYTYSWNNGQYTEDNPQNVSAGNYTLVITDANGCTETTSVQVNQPTALLVNIDNVSNYGGINVSCSDATDGSADAIGIGGTAPYTYEWSTGTQGASVDNLGTGTYQVVVTDNNGCSSVNEVDIVGPEEVSFNLNVEDPSCYGENDGSIIIEGQGGTGPYLYAIDGGNFSAINLYGGLTSGSYDIAIQDSNGCEQEEDVSIIDPQELVLDIGDLIVLQLGDSIRLDPQSSVDEFALDTFVWRNSLFNVFEPWVYPLETTNYQMTIVDEFGCTAVDDVQVRVEKNRLIYIPNAFTPNNDSNNEIFTIYGGTGVEIVKTFKVFNRWGEIVHEANNMYIGDPELGWDGMFRGELLNPMVLVYYAEVEFVDGRVELYKGDVTLMR